MIDHKPFLLRPAVENWIPKYGDIVATPGGCGVVAFTDGKLYLRALLKSGLRFVPGNFRISDCRPLDEVDYGRKADFMAIVKHREKMLKPVFEYQEQPQGAVPAR